jgi:hypothetical protein
LEVSGLMARDSDEAASGGAIPGPGGVKKTLSPRPRLPLGTYVNIDVAQAPSVPLTHDRRDRRLSDDTFHVIRWSKKVPLQEGPVPRANPENEISKELFNR